MQSAPTWRAKTTTVTIVDNVKAQFDTNSYTMVKMQARRGLCTPWDRRHDSTATVDIYV